MMVNTRLRFVMIDHGITGRELARLIGIAEPIVSYLTSGRVMPTPGDLKKICDVLNCDPSDIYQASDLSLASPLKNSQTMQLIQAAKDHLNSAGECLGQIV